MTKTRPDEGTGAAPAEPMVERIINKMYEPASGSIPFKIASQMQAQGK
jgi:hypothetical protein